MHNAALEKWTWVLIYGGALMASLGMFWQDAEAGARWVLISLGGLATAVGAVLIVVRSRRPD